MPMVVPPAALAPRAAAAMTSPSPPHTTMQPASPRSRPTSSARASLSAPLPMTDTCTAMGRHVSARSRRQIHWAPAQGFLRHTPKRGQAGRVLILLIGQVDLLVGKHPGARGLARRGRPRQLAGGGGLVLHEREDIADLGAAGLRRRERAQLRRRLLRGADRRPAPRRDVLELEGGPVERRFDRTEPGGRCRADDSAPAMYSALVSRFHALLRPRAAD